MFRKDKDRTKRAMSRDFRNRVHAWKIQEDRAKEEKRLKEGWRTASLQPRIQHFLRSGLHSDCQFLVGTEECKEKKLFQCHKIILCSASEVFERMLYGPFLEASTSEPIKIEDVTPEDFEIFLKVAYGDLEDHGSARPFKLMKWPALKGLLQLGNKYMADGFVEHCANWVYKLSLSCEETLDFYEFQFDINNHILQGKKWNERLRRMISGESWLKSERLFSMSVEAFTQLMHFTSKRISEIKKYNTINEYVNRLQPNEDQLKEAPPNEELNADNSNVDMTFAQYKQEVFRRLLQCINYNGMTPEEFIQGPGTSDVLSGSEKYELLAELTSNCLRLSKLTVNFHGPCTSNRTNYDSYDSDDD